MSGGSTQGLGFRVPALEGHVGVSRKHEQITQEVTHNCRKGMLFGVDGLKSQKCRGLNN